MEKGIVIEMDGRGITAVDNMTSEERNLRKESWLREREREGKARGK